MRVPGLWVSHTHIILGYNALINFQKFFTIPTFHIHHFHCSHFEVIRLNSRNDVAKLSYKETVNFSQLRTVRTKSVPSRTAWGLTMANVPVMVTYGSIRLSVKKYRMFCVGKGSLKVKITMTFSCPNSALPCTETNSLACQIEDQTAYRVGYSSPSLLS